MLKSYTIRFVPTARKDLVQMKTYILNKFKYPEYGVNFDKKIKEALMIIKKSPTSFKNTQLIYKGLNIYMNNIKSYLFFYVVDDVNIWILRVLKERMNWENIMKIWIKQND
ncbi:MAG: type II toxin-antitoxin system RelE/ParE family toxin [Lachnospiraceae bacterium]|nr:type II toxin-antitoxin system RelE/ParE family toxin [Lachnospiraceae bacterium]